MISVPMGLYRQSGGGLSKLSFEGGGTSPAEFEQLVKADLDRWGPIVKESGFTPEN